MDDKRVEDIMSSLDGMQKAAPPEDFAQTVMARWLDSQHQANKSLETVKYWAAACLVSFTLLNGLGMYALAETSDTGDAVTATATESEFAEEYKLYKPTEYYTFNEATK